jgi:cardiolipin synthase A/B
MIVPTVTQAANSLQLASTEALLHLATLAQAPLRFGHNVRVLVDGAMAFPAMLAVIRSAQRTVHFENFIMANDNTGRQFTAALERARIRGAQVRVLYDPIGTLLVRGGSLRRRLREVDAEVRPFRPLSMMAPWSWLRLRHRDHRKLLIADGRFAVVGGLCIADHWAPADEGGSGWRDTALLVRGPVVADLEVAFERMWRRAHRNIQFPTLTREESIAGLGATYGEAAATVVADRPGTQRVAKIYEWLADNAEESIELTDAYFVAPLRVLNALLRAAQRGVRVRLLLPGRNNHPLAGLAARRIYDPLLAAGAEIWEWDGMMLHAKTIVVDGVISMIGSSNLDPLSLHRNYELNVLVGDPRTGMTMRKLFRDDLDQATQVNPSDWARRPLRARIAERIASVFSFNL